MTIVTLVLMLVSGHVTAVLVDREACERTVQSVREGQRVTVVDNEGNHYEVERARCVLDFVKEIGDPTS